MTSPCVQDRHSVEVEARGKVSGTAGVIGGQQRCDRSPHPNYGEGIRVYYLRADHLRLDVLCAKYGIIPPVHIDVCEKRVGRKLGRDRF